MSLATVTCPADPRLKWHLARSTLAVTLLLIAASGCSASLARLPVSSPDLPAEQPPLHLPESADDSGRLSDRVFDGLHPLALSEGRESIADLAAAGNAAAELPTPSALPASLTPLSLDAVHAPVESVLYSIATELGAELLLSGALTQRVTLKVDEKPASLLLDQLALQGGFFWQLENRQLTVWNGESYGFTYAVDYLNMDRLTHSSVGLATQVGTINAANSTTGSVANSSQTRVENTSEHRFWTSLKGDVEGLLAQHSTGPANFTLNAEAGLLSVFGDPVLHQSIKRYLSLLHASTQRQVLIEATVVEVALSDSFEAGVDWQVLADGVSGISAAQVLVGAPGVNAESVGRLVAPAGLMSIVQQSGAGDVRATISLLEQFGDVRILSRPRIIALNNQSSILKVVDNRVYFTVNVERRQTDTRDEIVTETDIHTVPVGLVMNVTPQISSSGAVMLNVRPTLSRILGFVNDPNPELASANVRNGVPEIQVREMESMLQVDSGKLAIIGGLMQETTQENDSRLPGLGKLPVLRHLFSQRASQRRQTELLIVLRPTVLASASRVAQQ